MVLTDEKDGTTAIATSSHVWFLKRIERTFFGLQFLQAATLTHDRGECSGRDRSVRCCLGSTAACPAAATL
ncbi:MAG: hypothetical protein DCF22_07025 [Leptolyngbya sp.]|nr:MAG: hypothetical protein DCF22_07025 [Leptolyngbya sp.]